MDPKTEELINYSPLVELFGTFFERLTNQHSYKDPLRKELSEFKSVLYENQQNAAIVDSYLDALSKKKIIPAQSPLRKETIPTSAKYASPTLKTYQENDPKLRVSTNSSKKIEILPVADFLRYRSIAQADKNQLLITRYGHVQQLDKNPNNLYRTLAIYYFTLVLRSSGAEKYLSDLVDEVAAKRIELSCAAENLTHEEICGVFCGFFSQLLRMRRNRDHLSKL